MNDESPDLPPAEPRFDGTFEGTRLRQILAGLQLDHTARLRWLEERMAELFRLQGRVTAEPLRVADL